MGLFPTLATSYVIAAFVFQAIALGFIGLDKSCRSARPGWLLLTLLTGPVGLLIYFLAGRDR